MQPLGNTNINLLLYLPLLFDIANTALSYIDIFLSSVIVLLYL